MKCLSWNVRGLRDDRRRGVVGRYLREWGAEVVFLQETLMEHGDSRLWRALGWGEGGAHMVLEAVGRSGGDRLGMEG